MKRLKRKWYGEKIPEGAKLVARPSRWGNPYKLIDCVNVDSSLINYRKWLINKLKDFPDFLDPLKGFDLVCYCPLDEPCHADILIEFILTEKLMKELEEKDNV